MSADRKPGMDRRQFLKLAATTGALALSGAGLGILAQPGVAAAAGKPAEAGLGLAAKPVEAKPAAQAVADQAPIYIPRQRLGLQLVTLPVPTEFNPTGPMKNLRPNEAPADTYYHPKAREPHELPSEKRNWSYGVYLANIGRGVHSESVYAGQLVVQNDRSPATHALGIGTLTTYEGRNVIRDYETQGDHGDGTGDATAWIRTAPNSVLTVYDLDDGRVIGDHKINAKGDGGIILPHDRRVGAVWTVVDEKFDTFETFVRFGPHDDPEPKRNYIDARK